ncbi:MAG: hypothetical protein NC338_06255 [Firmicutes bacterium]|nr:hypothetical protein [Bacillota bacterium]
MKNLTILGFVSLIAVGWLTSCAPKGAEVEALPCAFDSTQFNMIDSKGQVIDLGVSTHSISPLVNGFFHASTPDGVTVYKLTADGPQPVEGLTGLVSAGYMACGVMPVCKQGNHIELVNDDGESVATITLDEGEVTECDAFMREGLLRVTTDSGMQGAVNTKGEFVVRPIFSLLGPVDGGKMLAMIEAEAPDGIVSQKYQLIDSKMNVLYEFSEYTPVLMDVRNGYVIVRKAGSQTFALCNAGGDKSIVDLPAEVRSVEAMGSDGIVIRDANGRKGIVDYSGHMLLPAKYKQVRLGPNGRVAVTDGSQWFLMDANGENAVAIGGASMVSPAPEASFAQGFAFVCRAAAGMYLVNTAGELVNAKPLAMIDNGGLDLLKVVTDYPQATTTIELPGDEDWIEN